MHNQFNGHSLDLTVLAGCPQVSSLDYAGAICYRMDILCVNDLLQQ